MTITTQRNGGITEITLDRPEKRNAIDAGMIDGLRAAAEAVGADGSCRVVVLHGAGASFCAGLDMANFDDMVSGDLAGDSESVRAALAERSPNGANRVQQLGWAWRELRVPVIAAVHGHALGGGLNVALGADIRIVAPDAKLGFVEVTWGLLPDMSGTQSLRRLVGPDRAKELIMTGRTVDGSEAVRLGMATEVAVDPLERARELARAIAGHSPEAVRAVKAVIDRSAEMGEADGLALEALASQELLGSSNQMEAVMARLEGRAPVFDDPPVGAADPS
ncbi:MAG: crotonase/enoyl-CoA hydratase family protein [Microthrixaceae bacterium]